MDLSTVSLLHERARPVVSANNLAPILEVVTWMLLSAMFLSMAIRLLSRRFIIQVTGFDDILILLAFMFALVQTLCANLPKDGVWGKHIYDVSQHDLYTGMKTQYAATLNFYVSLAFAKFSVLAGLSKLTPDRSHKSLVYGTCAAISIWLIATVFAVAFQCPTPDPWNIMQTDCRNRLGIYLYANIGNILTDAALIAIPITIIAPLQMPIRMRLFVLSLLCTRVFVIIGAIVQIAFLTHSLRSDFTFDSFAYNLATEVVLALSIISSCLPHLQPFMKSLRSGAVFTNDIGTQAMESNYNSQAATNGSRKGYMPISLASRSKSVKGEQAKSPSTKELPPVEYTD